MGAINPKTYKKPNPMGRLNAIGAPHSLVDFGGAVKYSGVNMTEKAQTIIQKIALFAPGKLTGEMMAGKLVSRAKDMQPGMKFIGRMEHMMPTYDKLQGIRSGAVATGRRGLAGAAGETIHKYNIVGGVSKNTTGAELGKAMGV